MSKSASLLFAALSVILMIATAVCISYNVWLAILFGALTCASIASGFVWKARRR